VAPERDWPRLVLDSELLAGEMQIRDREVPARERKQAVQKHWCSFRRVSARRRACASAMMNGSKHLV
jgi:hypothetical protein